MSKDAYYFSHDSNARNDEKILKLRMKHGWEGYGIFWAIVEMLREEEDFELQADYECIAFALQTDAELVQSIICNFDLFVLHDFAFFSASLKERMNQRKNKENRISEVRRKAAQTRWNNANAMQNNANAMQSNAKERKGKENKGKNKPPVSPIIGDDKFDVFWKAYPNRKGKQAALKSWKKMKPDLQVCLAAIERQKKTEQWRRDGGQYIPHPATWLNQGRWDDELPEVNKIDWDGPNGDGIPF